MEKDFAAFLFDPKRDFVRKSALSFSKTMRFILSMGSQTLGKELMEFYDFDPKMVYVSDIVQRRTKILPAAFNICSINSTKPSCRQISFTVIGFTLLTVLIYIF